MSAWEFAERAQFDEGKGSVKYGKVTVRSLQVVEWRDESWSNGGWLEDAPVLPLPPMSPPRPPMPPKPPLLNPMKSRRIEPPPTVPSTLSTSVRRIAPPPTVPSTLSTPSTPTEMARTECTNRT